MAEVPTARRAARALGIYLEPTASESTRVGVLLRDQQGNVQLVVDEAYIDLGEARPVLSSSWSAPGDEPATVERLRLRRDKRGRDGSLPPWFANLLPEGALRRLVHDQMPAGARQDFDMLARLGADLPGAVVARDEDQEVGLWSEADESRHEATQQAGEQQLLVKFSLAGIQLKLSMVEAGERLTMPASGQTGRVIVKLPVDHYPMLPELEYAAMSLARSAGVTVAECALAPTGSVHGISGSLLRHGENVLVTQRFDRTGEQRVHMEDFAQILGAVGDEKYSLGNEETNLRLVSRFVEDAAGAVLEAVRRTVVNILVGNGDAHLKNWSLRYSDGRSPALSPAYDIVPTIAYGDETMALKFGGTRTPARVGYGKLERAARWMGLSPRALVKEAERTIERAADTWPALLPNLPVTAALAAQLRARWSSSALAGSRPNPFS